MYKYMNYMYFIMCANVILPGGFEEYDELFTCKFIYIGNVANMNNTNFT